jgi:hypothetical protein
MSRVFTVSVPRGLYVRSAPIQDDSTLIGTPPFVQLKRGQIFEAVQLRKIDNFTWAQNLDGNWVVIANGRNPYVTENRLPFKPLG